MSSKLPQFCEKLKCLSITSIVLLIFSIWLVIGGIIAKGMFSHTLLDVALLSLFLVSLFIVVSTRNKVSLPKNIKFWGVLLVIFMALNLFPEVVRLFHGEMYIGYVIGYVERYLLIIIFVLLSVALFFKRVEPYLLFKILISSSLWVLLVLVYETLIFLSKGLNPLSFRYGGLGSSYVIDFGIYSNMLFIFLLGAVPWLKKYSKFWIISWLLSLMICFAGTLLSQSRTAWIGWPEALIGWGSFYIYYFKKYDGLSLILKNHLRILLSLSAFLIIMLGGVLGYQVVEKRINIAIEDIKGFQEGSPMTSLGNRFLMYEIGIKSLNETAFGGMGINHFKSYLIEKSQKELKDKYNMESSGLSYSHIHNQFLMTWLTEGVLAFISLVAIFFFLFIYYVKRLKTSVNDQQKALAVAGLVYTMASFMSFMPESPLNFKTTFIFFFILSSLLLVVNEVAAASKASEGMASS